MSSLCYDHSPRVTKAGHLLLPSRIEPGVRGAQEGPWEPRLPPPVPLFSLPAQMGVIKSETVSRDLLRKMDAASLQ